MNKGVNYGFYLNDFIFWNKNIFYASFFIGFFLAKLSKFLNIRYLNNVEHKNLWVNLFQEITFFIVYSCLFLNLNSLFWMLVFTFRR